MHPFLAGLKASTTYTVVLFVMAIAMAPAHAQDSTVEILVNGAPQKRYFHEGRVYVEALKGREYAIRLRNPYPVRIAVALSVDGLNTIDAEHTTAFNARKWVLDPHQTLTISGWQVSRLEARKFEFTTEPNSYAQALGKAANLGVISAAFFKERVPAAATEMAHRDSSRRQPQAGADAPSAAPSALGETASAGQSMGLQSSKLNEEYAATGMGERTAHAVTRIRMDLESTPAHTIDIRYEFHAQLVKLGVKPRRHEDAKVDPMTRRERSRGFEAGFSPEVR